MQSLPTQVLTTTFRFVEEILSAKLIKVTYFPGSLLMLVITRWEFKSNTLTSWVEQTNKSTNFQQKKLKKKAALLVIIFQKLADFCASSPLMLWHLTSIQNLINNSYRKTKEINV